MKLSLYPSSRPEESSFTAPSDPLTGPGPLSPRSMSGRVQTRALIGQLSAIPGLSLVEPGAAAGGERIGGSVCCLGCQWVEILKTERSKSDYILHVFN